MGRLVSSNVWLPSSRSNEEIHEPLIKTGIKTGTVFQQNYLILLEISGKNKDTS
jgi:hypothetical protein